MLFPSVGEILFFVANDQYFLTFVILIYIIIIWNVSYSAGNLSETPFSKITEIKTLNKRIRILKKYVKTLYTLNNYYCNNTTVLIIISCCFIETANRIVIKLWYLLKQIW